ncbi:hypothetical protein ACIP79_41525 [Streptomyces sp. NPDC088747]|uniref:hypothetical protein n=1 Tax=Streptomyces sp. NPDC088747 TaxID=3365886 RepID=UPI0037F7D10B
MKITVHHEADRTFQSLVPRLEAIAAATVPLVDAITGLALPDEVVIHTMTVDNWLRAHQRRLMEQLAEEVAQLGVPSEVIPPVRHQVMTALGFLQMNWPLMFGEAIDFTEGRPELVILPEALTHAGVLDDDRLLHKLVAHETTHLAQYATSDGEVWAMQGTFFPKLRGIADRAYGALMEGHAYWADREITTKIFGEPVTTDEISPLASDEYRELTKLRDHNPKRAEFAQGTAEVTQIIDTLGLHAFNQVWTRPDLVPLTSEIGAPGFWPRRFSNPLPPPGLTRPAGH